MRSNLHRIGKYELRSVLARTSLSTIYDGWDASIARRVAIKVMSLPDDPNEEGQELLTRFRRGAQAAGRLIHPNIVSVYDYGESDGFAYIVMEFVEGPTLKALFDEGQPFDLPRIQDITGGILQALQYSHDRGIVHRDVKPANVMFTREGRVKLTDFGVARIENSDITQMGTVVGTPAYMSPEQFLGERVDWRVDIYATGVVLYQLLTGERPYEGSLATIMHKVLHTTPPVPSNLSRLATPALDRIVARAMAKRREDRFGSASEFALALQQVSDVAAPVPPLSRLPGPSARLAPAGRVSAKRTGYRAPMLVGIAGVVMLLAVGAIGAVGYFGQSRTGRLAPDRGTRLADRSGVSVADAPHGAASSDDAASVPATAPRPALALAPVTPSATHAAPTNVLTTAPTTERPSAAPRQRSPAAAEAPPLLAGAGTPSVSGALPVLPPPAPPPPRRIAPLPLPPSPPVPSQAEADDQPQVTATDSLIVRQLHTLRTGMSPAGGTSPHGPRTAEAGAASAGPARPSPRASHAASGSSASPAYEMASNAAPSGLHARIGDLPRAFAGSRAGAGDTLCAHLHQFRRPGLPDGHRRDGFTVRPDIARGHGCARRSRRQRGRGGGPATGRRDPEDQRNRGARPVAAAPAGGGRRPGWDRAGRNPAGWTAAGGALAGRSASALSGTRVCLSAHCAAWRGADQRLRRGAIHAWGDSDGHAGVALPQESRCG